MNDPSHMMNRSFGIWNPAPPEDPGRARPVFSSPANSGRMKWKRKKVSAAAGGAAAGGAASGGAAGAVSAAYKPPTLKELQSQNRARARRFYPKKKFTRFAPSAPFNNTSFIIRAKKAGGLASLVSPCPVTPAILPTPKFSPSRERLVDMAKEEWGVDGYGSMKGLIRLRPGAGDAEEADDGSSESDVEEHAEVERRLDQDLSRFEMVYPSEEAAPDTVVPYRLEHRIDEHDTHIARLEEENLTLKERLFLMEREMEELRRRLSVIETEQGARDANVNDEDNNVIPDDVSDARGDVRSRSGRGDCEGSDETPTPINQNNVKDDVNNEATPINQNDVNDDVNNEATTMMCE